MGKIARLFEDEEKVTLFWQLLFGLLSVMYLLLGALALAVKRHSRR